MMMGKLNRIGIATVVVALLGFSAVGIAPVPGELPACATEDSADCFWDATVHGNGEGRSFVDRDGHVTYVPACTDAIADAGGICHGEPR